MCAATIEIYHPRDVSNLGQWDIGDLKLKVYGLVADDKKIDGPMVTMAQSFVRRDVLPRVADEGDDNGMGFVIIHRGHRAHGYGEKTRHRLRLGIGLDKRRARGMAKNDDEKRAQSIGIHGRQS